MNRIILSRIAGGLLLAAAFSLPAFPQAANSPTDLSGEWRRLTNHEDAHERGPGPDPGEYWGLPLNDAERMTADAYNGEILSTNLYFQCRPHPTGYQQLGPDAMRIEKEIEPVNRQLIAYRVLFQRTPGNRMIWLDGRDRPSEHAAHSWEGFSLGKWTGDTLTIDTTHLKQSFIRRNGVQGSFRRTVTEHVSLDEPYLTWVLIVNDPDYLTESLIRSVTFVRAPNTQVPVYPCAPQEEEYRPEDAKYRVPFYLPGENPYLTEVAFKYKTPLLGVRGGAESMYPEFVAKIKAEKPPAQQFTLKPVYNDASTRIAESIANQPIPAPKYDKVETLHVKGNIYMLSGAGANIALSAGGDGVIMVDAGAAPASDKIIAAVKDLVAHEAKPADRIQFRLALRRRLAGIAFPGAARHPHDHRHQRRSRSRRRQRQHRRVVHLPSHRRRRRRSERQRSDPLAGKRSAGHARRKGSGARAAHQYLFLGSLPPASLYQQ